MEQDNNELSDNNPENEFRQNRESLNISIEDPDQSKQEHMMQDINESNIEKQPIQDTLDGSQIEKEINDENPKFNDSSREEGETLDQKQEELQPNN